MKQHKSSEEGAAQSRVITQRVACEWRRAYVLAADPRRLPEWASGLAKSALVPHGDHWIVRTPERELFRLETRYLNHHYNFLLALAQSQTDTKCKTTRDKC